MYKSKGAIENSKLSDLKKYKMAVISIVAKT